MVVNQQRLPLGHLGREGNQGAVGIDDERLGLFGEDPWGSFTRDGNRNTQNNAAAPTAVVLARVGRPVIHSLKVEEYEPGGKPLAGQVVTKGNGLCLWEAEANLLNQGANDMADGDVGLLNALGIVRGNVHEEVGSAG